MHLKMQRGKFSLLVYFSFTTIHEVFLPIYRKAQHAKNVSWLRRTEYISTEATRFQPMTIEKIEAKVGYSMKKALKEENIYMDHESQIKAIEKTFADAKKPIIEHSSKKGVTAVEVLPVIPDFKVFFSHFLNFLPKFCSHI